LGVGALLLNQVIESLTRNYLFKRNDFCTRVGELAFVRRDGGRSGVKRLCSIADASDVCALIVRERRKSVRTRSGEAPAFIEKIKVCHVICSRRFRLFAALALRPFALV
jgi:hypothetical protein